MQFSCLVTTLLRTFAIFSICAISFSSTQNLPDFGVPNFTCNNAVFSKSAKIPENVNSVRPADIKIVMALGDSLTAGNGAGALNVSDVKLQYRGLSFAAGGDKTLADHATVPNILKMFNPQLFGYSNGIGSNNVWNVAHLNVAVPGAHSSDLPSQARQLVTLLHQHPELVDFKNDWKLLNIFIGANDVCDYCTNPNDTPTKCVEQIKTAIQIIQDNVPRVIVSLTNMLHLEMLKAIEVGNAQCIKMHKMECYCVDQQNTPESDLTKTIAEYNKIEMELQSSGIFEKDDFTLVIQPFFSNTTNPPIKNGVPDLSFFAPDCFHFSQLGHAVVSTHLWKNMLQPVGAKTNQVNISSPALPLSCPDQNCPFIRTVLNSRNCTPYLTS